MGDDLIIGNLDPALLDRLKARALEHGRPLEAEVRESLRCAAPPRELPARRNPVDVARELFGAEHGVDLDIPPRCAAPTAPPPDFSDF